jgi:ubiquinone/menaquinone biosynthesis C-methylase UbiE
MLVLLTLALLAPDAAAKEGPNDKFLRADLDVDAWVKRFETPGREVYDKRREIVAATKVRKGAAVADVGAGTGFFTLELAQAVGPTGKVYAVDIAPRFLAHIAKRAAAAGHKNVTTVRGTARSVELPAASVDLVFLCDTYHHFEDPKSSLASIRRALRPGGEIAVVDFKREAGKTAKWIHEHVRAGQQVVTSEIEAAGFQKLEEVPLLKENYMLRFRLAPERAPSKAPAAR